MALLSLHDISMAFGSAQLLDGVAFHIEAGERICLVGRNGAGKSTMMKLMAGRFEPDGGHIAHQPGLTVTMLNQESANQLTGSVYDVVAAGLVDQPEDGDNQWRQGLEIDTILSRLNLVAEDEYQTLSGGLKRRTMLARALAGGPDILLLDEPTNQLDIESITWLEDFLMRHVPTVMIVSHDRMFLKRLGNRVIELDRGRLIDWNCDYDTYLTKKNAQAEVEDRNRAAQDKKLSEEEVWLRQGVKARRTRNEGRVRRLLKMRQDKAVRLDRIGSVKMETSAAGRSGKIVVEAKGVSFDYGLEPVIDDLTTTVVRGDRIGLIGPNGVGKTTLLKVLLGKLNPKAGTIRHGANLEVVYFDQFREQLDEDATVRDNIDHGNDHVVINDHRRHVIGYLKDFLFSPERAASPVRTLSGGERNRLLLAKLFTKPSNVLVLDEPTNDLDADTLDLLETVLMDYQGTILLVSHDRAFLNNVITSTMVFEGRGRITEYAGGYDDWLLQRTRAGENEKFQKKTQSKSRMKAAKPRKRTYKENQELAKLPATIENLETEQALLQETLSDPDFYKGPGEEVSQTNARLAELDVLLESAYERWEQLDSIPS